MFVQIIPTLYAESYCAELLRGATRREARDIAFQIARGFHLQHPGEREDQKPALSMPGDLL